MKTLLVVLCTLIVLPSVSAFADSPGKLSPYCQKRLNRYGLKDGSKLFGIEAYKACDSLEKRSEEIFENNSSQISNGGRKAYANVDETTKSAQAGAIQECRNAAAEIKLKGDLTNFVCIPLPPVHGPLWARGSGGFFDVDFVEFQVHTVVFLIDATKLSTSEYYLKSY